jgi:hypothetical protein
MITFYTLSFIYIINKICYYQTLEYYFFYILNIDLFRKVKYKMSTKTK